MKFLKKVMIFITLIAGILTNNMLRKRKVKYWKECARERGSHEVEWRESASELCIKVWTGKCLKITKNEVGLIYLENKDDIPFVCIKTISPENIDERCTKKDNQFFLLGQDYEFNIPDSQWYFSNGNMRNLVSTHIRVKEDDSGFEACYLTNNEPIK